MSTRREVTVTKSLSEETLQHILEIEKCVEVGIGSKTNEEAKQIISSLTSCLEENEVLRIFSFRLNNGVPLFLHSAFNIIICCIEDNRQNVDLMCNVLRM